MASIELDGVEILSKLIDIIKRDADLDMIGFIPHMKNLILYTILKGENCLPVSMNGTSFVSGYKSISNTTLLYKLVLYFRDQMGFTLIDCPEKHVWILKWQK